MAASAAEGSRWEPVRLHLLDFGHDIAKLDAHVSKLVAFVTKVRASQVRGEFTCEHEGVKYKVRGRSGPP